RRCSERIRWKNFARDRIEGHRARAIPTCRVGPYGLPPLLGLLRDHIVSPDTAYRDSRALSGCRHGLPFPAVLGLDAPGCRRTRSVTRRETGEGRCRAPEPGPA